MQFTKWRVSQAYPFGDALFTEMNNLDVITTTSDEYASTFGFTENEVFDAFDDTGLGSEKGEVKKWYDGFTFGAHKDIYNPWSISTFIKKNRKYENYWADTSSNGLVNSLMQTGVPGIKQTMESLLQGKSLRRSLMKKSSLTSLTAVSVQYGACCWRLDA